MQEAVIFPKPEEVNIIATRNGELTNIKGTEFRAPLAPYRTEFEFQYSSVYGLYVNTKNDTTAIPISVFKWVGIPNMTGDTIYKWESFATCVNAYERYEDDSDEFTWTSTYFQGQLISPTATPPAQGEDIGFLVQLIGNKSTQHIDDTGNTGSWMDPVSIILPPSHSERVFVKVKGKMDPGYWTPYGA